MYFERFEQGLPYFGSPDQIHHDGFATAISRLIAYAHRTEGYVSVQ